MKTFSLIFSLFLQIWQDTLSELFTFATISLLIMLEEIETETWIISENTYRWKYSRSHNLTKEIIETEERENDIDEETKYKKLGDSHLEQREMINRRYSKLEKY